MHIIEFPGGAVEVSRTSDESYWIHAIVNNSQAVDDAEGLHARLGEVIDGRIDRDYPLGVETVREPATIQQFALRIRARQ